VRIVTVPEMPEVETILMDLKPLLAGRRIVSADCADPSAIKMPGAHGEFCRRVAGTTIVDLHRIAKYLILRLDTGDEIVLHLRMTGRLVYDPDGEQPATRERVALKLDGGGTLRFVDLRRLGTLHLVRDARRLPAIEALGPDPLAPRFTARRLRRLLRGRRSRIKPLLMDQRFLAGLGNIYANEALHCAGIRPTRRAHTITMDEARRLHRAVRRVLRKGVMHGGASTRTYRRPDGSVGRFQEAFEVYDRAGAPCPTCGEPIKRIMVAGRGTFYCSRCQR